MKTDPKLTLRYTTWGIFLIKKSTGLHFKCFYHWKSMGWTYGFSKITETWCADAFEMTCKQGCGCLSELPLWATSWENMFMPYANNNGADPSAHLLFAAKIVSQRRKKHMARPEFEPRISCILCEHSVNWATEPHGRPVTISPCLKDSSPNLLRTMPEPTKKSLCCSQPEHGPTLATKCHRGGKAHGPTMNRTKDLSHTVRALWPLATEPHGRPVTIV